MEPGATLMEATRQAGLPLGSSCDGRAVCGWCRVVVLRGSDRLEPPALEERQLLERIGAGAGERIACQARPRGGGGAVSITTTYW